MRIFNVVASTAVIVLAFGIEPTRSLDGTPSPPQAALSPNQAALSPAVAALVRVAERRLASPPPPG